MPVTRGLAPRARALRVLTLAGAACLLASAASALSLREAIERALVNNERPAIVAQRLEAARARIDVARSLRLPAFGIAADLLGQRTTAVQGSPELVAEARVDVPLFVPSAGPLIRRERLLTESAELDVRDERRLLMRDVTEAFLLALSAEQVVQAAERRRDYADLALSDAKARAEAGLASINDVTKVELERLTAVRDATSARADLEETYLLLAFLTDDVVTGPLERPEGLLRAAVQPPPAPEELALLAQEQRLDVKSRRKVADSFDAWAEEPPRRFIPSFSLTGRQEVSTEFDSSGADDDWDVGLGMTWSVFDAGLRAAQHRERLALASESELQAGVLERSVENDVRRAHVGMVTTQSAVQEASLAVDAARRNAEETFELYRRGLRTALDVADAGNRAFDADVSLTRERLSLTLAWVDLQVAIGADPLSSEPLP